MENSQYYYLLAGVLALFPALIWFFLLLKKRQHKGVQLLIFSSGVFAVIPILLIQILFVNYPEWNFIEIIDQRITDRNLHFLLTFAWVSITEELVKQWLVRSLDRRKLIVQTINDSIRYSLIAALGFSFAENIFYFVNIGSQFGYETFITAFFFRSIFTTAAHLVFSGFFGYYYGIAKFAINIFEQNKISGKKMLFSTWVGRLLNISKLQAFRETMIIKGLFFAITLHTFYNYLLQFQLIIPATLFITVCFIYLLILLKNKAGRSILITDSANNQASTMAPKDEDVVIELLGMWFTQKKYVDVIHICERLLKRDPDNKIVQLFKAQAVDKMESTNPYKKILGVLFEPKQKR